MIKGMSVDTIVIEDQNDKLQEAEESASSLQQNDIKNLQNQENKNTQENNTYQNEKDLNTLVGLERFFTYSK